MSRRERIDQETLQALNQDNAKAQLCVFDNYYDGLVVYSEKITRNHQASREVASDALRKLFLLPSKHFDHLAGLKKWLKKTVTHLSIDYLRRNKKYRNQIPYTESLTEIESQFDQIVEFDQAVFQLVTEAMAHLPPQARLVFTYKLNGWSTKQIAKLLQLKDSTVQSHKCLAIKFIQQYLIQRGKLPLSPEY